MGPYPGTHGEVICSAKLVPVVGPHSPIRELKEPFIQENSSILIADRTGETDGTEFCRATYFCGRNWTGAQVESSTSFARADLALQAAICGMGVALGRTLLVEDDIHNGFLIPIGKSVATKAKYWIVTTASFSATPTYREIRKFFKEEVQNSAQVYAL
ncbi:LysR substrate-binding domain-containing protein [Aliiroseovarius sp. S1339]|nr:LysR substrate-binding domain-containing protein [Aliiroseovarius sp. S1339]